MDSPIKKDSEYGMTPSTPTDVVFVESKLEENEVFATGADGVNFRTVGWVRGMSFTSLLTSEKC